MKIIGTQTLTREAVKKAAADLAQRQQAVGILGGAAPALRWTLPSVAVWGDTASPDAALR